MLEDGVCHFGLFFRRLNGQQRRANHLDEEDDEDSLVQPDRVVERLLVKVDAKENLLARPLLRHRISLAQLHR